MLRKLLGHLKTITHHRHLVMRNCFRAGIGLQGLKHDLSKYAWTEFIPGVRFYAGDHSPTESERKKYGYSAAWMHHKGRNRHHFEYWTDYIPALKRQGAVEMPARYVVESFCDRVAASKTYLKEKYTQAHPLDYFDKSEAPRAMHPASAALLRNLLQTLAEEGEEAAFRRAREILQNEKCRREK